MNKDKHVEPKGVDRYLKTKFRDRFGAARKEMRDLAKAIKPELLAEISFRLYEHFRPSIPENITGWGTKGKLDLDRIGTLASKSNPIS